MCPHVPALCHGNGQVLSGVKIRVHSRLHRGLSLNPPKEARKGDADNDWAPEPWISTLATDRLWSQAQIRSSLLAAHMRSWAQSNCVGVVGERIEGELKGDLAESHLPWKQKVHLPFCPNPHPAAANPRHISLSEPPELQLLCLSSSSKPGIFWCSQNDQPKGKCCHPN